MSSTPEELVKFFLKDHTCLIVEPSRAFASGIQGRLVLLGVPFASIYVARKYEEAKDFIARHRPKVLITEYEIDHNFGLSLVEMQGEQYDEASKVAMIVTRNSTDSVVAEAAEEHVDSYILKPFSPDAFEQRLVAAIQAKVKPTPYAFKIAEGKRLLFRREVEKALEAFGEAKELNSTPALACYYCGLSHQFKGDLVQALIQYRQGRAHLPLHYKCLTAEFEVLMKLNQYAEAYKLIEPLTANYPLTPKRLTHIFVTSVFTLHFDELPAYFEMFMRLDQRSPELVRVAAQAMLSAGKYFLMSGEHKRAKKLLDDGLAISGRDLFYMDKMINELVRAKARELAREYLGKLPSTSLGSALHQRLLLKVDQLFLSPKKLVERARKLVADGHADYETYKVVVQVLAQAGKPTLAESVIQRALKDYPNVRTELYDTLEEFKMKAVED